MSPSTGSEDSERDSGTHDDSEPLSEPLRPCFYPACRNRVGAAPRYDDDGEQIPDPRANYCISHAASAEQWRAAVDTDTRAMERQVTASMSGGYRGTEDSEARRPTRKTLPSEWDPVRSPPHRRPSWWADAACRGYDLSIFHPLREDERSTAEARAVCATCPVREPCLEDSLAPMELLGRRVPVEGVRAGLTTRERAALRTSRARARESTA